MATAKQKAEYDRRVQERIWTRIAASHERRLRVALRAIYKGAADTIEGEGLLEVAINLARPKVEQALRGMMAQSYQQIGDRVAAQIAEANGKSWRKFDFSAAFARALESYLRVYAVKRAIGIIGTVADRVRGWVRDGVEGGLTNRDIAKAIRTEGLRDTMWRAQMIAQTETHSAAMAGGHAAAKESEAVRMKNWVSVNDDRTRGLRDNSDFNHVSVESVPIDQPFIVSGEELMYPGDPNGSPGNIINCRCVVTYSNPDSVLQRGVHEWD
jgi:uncharacterized protein with gpF-like domain